MKLVILCWQRSPKERIWPIALCNQYRAEMLPALLAWGQGKFLTIDLPISKKRGGGHK